MALLLSACAGSTDNVGPSQHPPMLEVRATESEAAEVRRLSMIGWQDGTSHVIHAFQPFAAGATTRVISFSNLRIAPLDSVRVSTAVSGCSPLGTVDTVIRNVPASAVTSLPLASPPSALARLEAGQVACGGGKDPRASGDYYFLLRLDASAPAAVGYWTIDFSRTHRGWHGRFTATVAEGRVTLQLVGTPGDPPCGPSTATVEMQGLGMAHITFQNPEGCYVPDVRTALYLEKQWPALPEP